MKKIIFAAAICVVFAFQGCAAYTVAAYADPAVEHGRTCRIVSGMDDIPDGDLEFLDAGMDEIAATLERHFGVTIDAGEEFYRPGERYTIKFMRGDSLEAILDVLRDVAGGFEYIRTGDTIHIGPPL